MASHHVHPDSTHLGHDFKVNTCCHEPAARDLTSTNLSVVDHMRGDIPLRTTAHNN